MNNIIKYKYIFFSIFFLRKNEFLIAIMQISNQIKINNLLIISKIEIFFRKKP